MFSPSRLSRPDRRTFLAATGLAGLAACSRVGAGQQTLFVGDQREGQKSVLQVVHALDDLPYRITWSNFPNAAPLLEALNAGAIDTGFGGDAAFIFAIGSGAHVKTIGALRSKGLGPVLVVRSESPVHHISQIKGMRIATPRGSISHNLILAALEKHGLPPQAVHFAFLSPQDGEAALRGGSVDGWAIWDPNAALAIRRGGMRLVDGCEGLVASYTLLFGSDKALADKRPLLADYRDRLYRGWAWAAAHPADYAQMMARQTGLDADLWHQVLDHRQSEPVPVDAQLIADQQATADRYLRAGLIPRHIDVAQGFVTSLAKDKS
jgi:sulfonate transport system substrate-binding protein